MEEGTITEIFAPLKWSNEYIILTSLICVKNQSLFSFISSLSQLVSSPPLPLININLNQIVKFFIFVPDVPIATLKMGSNLNPNHIKEGDDVYFECSVQANPRVTRLAWYKEVSDSKFVI